MTTMWVPPATASCNLCGSTEWVNQGSREGVRCARCASVERTRAIKLILDRLGLPKESSTILHLAPERGLYLALSQSPWYDAIDLDPRRYSGMGVRTFDLVRDSETLPTNYYDLIIHSHVAEHVPCNIAHVFFHLSRSLKPDGFHIFSVPLMPGHYDETFEPISEETATLRFGQHDHVRRFGVKDIGLHLGKIMKLNLNYSLARYATEEQMDQNNIPPSQRSGLNGSTIFIARKQDYLLADWR